MHQRAESYPVRPAGLAREFLDFDLAGENGAGGRLRGQLGCGRNLDRRDYS